MYILVLVIVMYILVDMDKGGRTAVILAPGRTTDNNWIATGLPQTLLT